MVGLNYAKVYCESNCIDKLFYPKQNNISDLFFSILNIINNKLAKYKNIK